MISRADSITPTEADRKAMRNAQHSVLVHLKPTGIGA